MYGKENLAYFWKDRIGADVIRAFQEIPREEFVLGGFKNQSYLDSPLPILRGKTISQPSTILLMTQALELRKGLKVLEVGAGSGYQSALIARIVGERGTVVSTEVIPDLVGFARDNLRRLGINNVNVFEHDGSLGYEEKAPYDRAIITAACPFIPKPIIEQVKEEGVIVAPVGDLHNQQMVKAVKFGKRLELQFLGNFVFSPLVGKFGFKEEELPLNG